MSSIAIVGMSCEYPGARSPQELWENALAQRQMFRRIPNQRLNLNDYFSPDPEAPDKTYLHQAALIEGYIFDRVAFRISRDAFCAADMVHWLALDVAARALRDAGYPDGKGLPFQRTGVLIGNSLTGEFSRAGLMRLRWPFVRRVVDGQLRSLEWDGDRRTEFLKKLEADYKKPFEPIGADSLAGGLSNTVAGRICNYFGFQGGGYTVDGACASSLLAIAHACSALVSGDLDVVIAGGVDLSLDPFELVGFAKTRALAPFKMRVFDEQAAGFIPGEGCGIVVLRRAEDAVADGQNIYGLIRGWGISSDGKGGITRPELEGQKLAYTRAYRRTKSISPTDVGYFECHGTGTPIGDETELKGLIHIRAQADSPAALGSVKANIGHTKAAAGVAGLIKATMALQAQVIPPATAVQRAHYLIEKYPERIELLTSPKVWPQKLGLYAGVSAMGFGGINTHIVLEGASVKRDKKLGSFEQKMATTPQDCELFIFSAQDLPTLRARIERTAKKAGMLAVAELTDLARSLAEQNTQGPWRAAIVAATPAKLEKALNELSASLMLGKTRVLDPKAGIFLGQSTRAPVIGFVFSGQAAPIYESAGAFAIRFPWAESLYGRPLLPQDDVDVSTDCAQLSIVKASLVGLRLLNEFGVHAQVALGHSLGELTAMSWAGAMSESQLIKLATIRGRAMAEWGHPDGAMSSINANASQIENLRREHPSITIAAYNAAERIVIAAKKDDLAAAEAHLNRKGISSIRLPVSRAFHCSLMDEAMKKFSHQINSLVFEEPQKKVFSTIKGGSLDSRDDLTELLCRQFVAPVKFSQALSQASDEVELWLEVGPGKVFSKLAEANVDGPVLATDSCGPTLSSFLKALGAAYALGADLHIPSLFANRYTRPFDLNQRQTFFSNPCEDHPPGDDQDSSSIPDLQEPKIQNDIPERSPKVEGSQNLDRGVNPRQLLPLLVAQQTELPLSAVRPEMHMLDDLHLNSLAVTALLTKAADRLGAELPLTLGRYINASVAEISDMFARQKRKSDASDSKNREGQVAGVASWTRVFRSRLVEKTLTRTARSTKTGQLMLVGHPDHPLRSIINESDALRSSGAVVVVLLLDAEVESNASTLLKGVKTVISKGMEKIVFLQQHPCAEAFARSFALEYPHIATAVITLPFEHVKSLHWIEAELAALTSFCAAVYDDEGRRYEHVIVKVPTKASHGEIDCLGRNDVVIVTGGAKGITAECALAIAKKTNVKLILMGRSQPKSDVELRENLARFDREGVEAHYEIVNVTDVSSVTSTVERIQANLGPISGILHGAAINEPKPIAALGLNDVRRTLAPKLDGLRNLLAAIDPHPLKVLISFGSIIGQFGLEGEADYALANEMLAAETEAFQQAHPACRCLTLEWSLWSEIGMAERLQSVEALSEKGISPITPDLGKTAMLDILKDPSLQGRLIVSSRFAPNAFINYSLPELPFLRFLEQVRVFYPGIELVVDCRLSHENDPYLHDHVFDGMSVFPAVMGLEAMAQVAVALSGVETKPSAIESVSFSRPIVVPQGTQVHIRIAALMREDGVVKTEIRCQHSDFRVDHFSARVHFDDTPPSLERKSIDQMNPLGVAPQEQLYGNLFFQKGRFKRVTAYRQLNATCCIADIASDADTTWFGRFYPQELILGDPGRRDAALHGVQVCVPQTHILPNGIGEIRFHETTRRQSHIIARESKDEGDSYTYDIDIAGIDGALQEEMHAVTFGSVAARTVTPKWPAVLFGPYFQRLLKRQFALPDLRMTVEKNRDQTCTTPREENICVLHSEALTATFVENEHLVCSLQTTSTHTKQQWKELLGANLFSLANKIAEIDPFDMTQAGTIVSSLRESMRQVNLDEPKSWELHPEENVHGITMNINGKIFVALTFRPSGIHRDHVLTALSLSDWDQRHHDAARSSTRKEKSQ